MQYVAGAVLEGMVEHLDERFGQAPIEQTGPDAATTRVWWDGAYYRVTATFDGLK